MTENRNICSNESAHKFRPGNPSPGSLPRRYPPCTSPSARAPTPTTSTSASLEWIGHWLGEVVRGAVHFVFLDVTPVVLNLVVFFLHVFALIIVIIVNIVFQWWFQPLKDKKLFLLFILLIQVNKINLYYLQRKPHQA